MRENSAFKKNSSRVAVMKREPLVPVFCIVPLLAVLAWNMLVYSGSMRITRDWYHHNIEFGIDKLIPFVPWTVSIYLICYLFWVANYIICARKDKVEAYRFLGADILAKTVCFVFYILLPTTNVRPEVVGTTIWDEIMRVLYQVDMPSNLFPSIHCLVSWLCYVGVRRKKHIPMWYQVFSCVMAIAVFISTLTTKQHVVIDVIAGLVLAEVCYWITGKMIKMKKIQELLQKKISL